MPPWELQVATPLTNVREFKNSFLSEIRLLPDVDLSIQTQREMDVSDLIELPTVDIIQQEIQRELIKFKSPVDHEPSSVTLNTGRGRNQSMKLRDEGLLAKSVTEYSVLSSVDDLEKGKRERGNKLASYREPRSNRPKLLKREQNYISGSKPSHAPDSAESDELIGASEVILSVAVHDINKGHKLQEYLVLGSQPLTDLKDHIYCLQDHIFGGDQTPSGYFFIENVFYNDMRSPQSVDYSSPIIGWLQQKDRLAELNMSEPTATLMSEIRFEDLSIRLGQKYLYCHQGNCEHCIVFHDIRLPHPSDPQQRSAYPLQTFQSKIKRRKCDTCQLYPAKFVCYGDRLADSNPVFYCDHCYRPLHYNAEGQLLFDDFQVFPYYHD